MITIPKNPVNEYFSILSNTDLLLYILRSFKTNLNDKTFLELKIKDLDKSIIKKPNEIITCYETDILLEAFEKMSLKNISFMPIINRSGKFLGFLKKRLIMGAFKHKQYQLLIEPVSKYLDFLKEKSVIEQNFLENIFFTPDNNIYDVLSKFIYTRGHLVWVKDELLRGFISLYDVFDIFLYI